MATISVERIAERCEAEFERLRAARPALSSRIGRAGNILAELMRSIRFRQSAEPFDLEPSAAILIFIIPISQ